MVKQYNNSYKTTIHEQYSTWKCALPLALITLWSVLVMPTASFRKYSGANYCIKMSYIRCWRCSKMWIHQSHDLFPVINTPVKIFQCKLETHLPHAWSQEVLEAAHRLGIFMSFFRRCSINPMETFPR